MSFRIVGIGEVLWDVLPSGRKLGGAPANFTYHASALGAEARLISRVGADALGNEALERLTALGVDTSCVERDAELPTGTVDVTFSGDHPQFHIRENVAWDHLAGAAPGRLAAESADAICFGTLAQRGERSRQAIRSLVGSTRPEALRVLDVNLRPPFVSERVIEESLTLANVVKLNEGELPQLATMLRLEGEEPRGQIGNLAGRFGLRCVVFTRGKEGSLIYSEGNWSEHAGVPTAVIDTVGAGDAFTAAVTLGLLAQWPLDALHQRASEVASFVCSQPGATPPLPEMLRRGPMNPEEFGCGNPVSPQPE